MNSPLLAPLGRTATARRVLIQTVKRSPLDLRRPLRIPAAHNAATIASLLSAYCRISGSVLDPEQRRRRIEWAIGLLEQLRVSRYERPCWGYHFDVETRFFFYSAQTPNVIATGFAALALLDAHRAVGSERALELALGAAEFLATEIELTPDPDGGPGAYFGYFPGDRTPIHNASLLTASVLAALDPGSGRSPGAGGGAAEPGAGPVAEARYADAVAAATSYAIAHQRPDGSWPYAEREAGDWVDGHHTGYVLDALGRIAAAGGGRAREAAAARHRGLELYAARLFEPSGAARFFADSLYPLDSQSLAQGIATFVAAAELDPSWLDAARRVYLWGAGRMRRRDGAFIFQRRRLWANRAPHVRWVQAPMLDALSRLLEVEESA